jgi:hypothetical protein
LPGRAFLAETPIDDPGDDRRNVAALWEFAGLKDQAPEATKGFSMLTASAKKSVAAAFRSGRLTKPKAYQPVASASPRPVGSSGGTSSTAVKRAKKTSRTTKRRGKG